LNEPQECVWIPTEGPVGGQGKNPSKSVKKNASAKQKIYPNIYIYVKHFIEIILAPQYNGLSKGIKKIGGGKPRTFHKNF
jgi:hypothetical protein